MDAGRMAVVQDPTGAVFCLWQAKRNTGIGIASVNGTLCWADLSTPDAKRASDFYSGLFGWQSNSADARKIPPAICTSRMASISSEAFHPSKYRPPGAPPHWMAYFRSMMSMPLRSKAKELGAKSVLPPMTMEGVGRMSVIADPQGAVFCDLQIGTVVQILHAVCGKRLSRISRSCCLTGCITRPDVILLTDLADSPGYAESASLCAVSRLAEYPAYAKEQPHVYSEFIYWRSSVLIQH